MHSPDSLKNRLIGTRTRNGMTQKQLADAAGVSPATIAAIESGRIKSPRSIKTIAAALDVSPAWLATGTDAAVLPQRLTETGFPFRIGQGYDVHQLVAGRPLVLGGVTIPYDKGLLGHSDADALLHAVTDALLGAAGLGDIGSHFPDTAAEYKNADSRLLLRRAYDAVKAQGLRAANADCTVIAQQPKLAPHTDAMRANIAADLGLPETCVNIKGKTNEKLGYLGRGEAIEAQAAVLLYRAA